MGQTPRPLFREEVCDGLGHRTHLRLFRDNLREQTSLAKSATGHFPNGGDDKVVLQGPFKLCREAQLRSDVEKHPDLGCAGKRQDLHFAVYDSRDETLNRFAVRSRPICVNLDRFDMGACGFGIP